MLKFEFLIIFTCQVGHKVMEICFHVTILPNCLAFTVGLRSLEMRNKKIEVLKKNYTKVSLKDSDSLQACIQAKDGETSLFITPLVNLHFEFILNS